MADRLFATIIMLILTVQTYGQDKFTLSEASRLPSFYLSGNLMNFDRSLTLLQNPKDGTLNYVSSNNLQNGLGLEISQNITFTGGTLSLYSDLSRIDQFGNNKSLTWYSRPITLSYYQPLFTYNQSHRHCLHFNFQITVKSSVMKTIFIEEFEFAVKNLRLARLLKKFIVPLGRLNISKLWIRDLNS